MRLLFICNQNMHRSKTAEALFKGLFETRSAGVWRNLPSKDVLDWADILVVMEDAQRERLAELFPQECLKKRVITLGVPDCFSFNEPELVTLLQRRVNELVVPFKEELECGL